MVAHDFLLKKKIPGLESFVQEQVHATLGPMMYAPNVFTLDVAGMMSGATDLSKCFLIEMGRQGNITKYILFQTLLTVS